MLADTVPETGREGCLEVADFTGHVFHPLRLLLEDGL